MALSYLPKKKADQERGAALSPYPAPVGWSCHSHQPHPNQLHEHLHTNTGLSTPSPCDFSFAFRIPHLTASTVILSFSPLNPQGTGPVPPQGITPSAAFPVANSSSRAAGDDPQQPALQLSNFTSCICTFCFFSPLFPSHHLSPSSPCTLLFLFLYLHLLHPHPVLYL